MQAITVKAYGKVNLGLDITGLREDGYHLVRMIMQTVPVYDELTVTRQPADAGTFDIRILCDDPSVPADHRNLAYKAAQKICCAYALQDLITIQIRKQIPVEAGMAGGSADAAGVIDAMNQLYALQMTMEQKDHIAVSLGADVPFCLRRGTYLAEGIGEKLTRVSDIPHCYMVIVKPAARVSTAWAYRAFDEYSGCGHTVAHPSIDDLVNALKQGDIHAAAGCMGNVLETVTIPAHPLIQKIKDELAAYGALKTLMSGSGPTVFSIFTDPDKAENAFIHLGGEEINGKFKIEF